MSASARELRHQLALFSHLLSGALASKKQSSLDAALLKFNECYALAEKLEKSEQLALTKD